jgi:hypothetical protein
VSTSASIKQWKDSATKNRVGLFSLIFGPNIPAPTQLLVVTIEG